MYFYLTGIDRKGPPIDLREKHYRNRKSIAGFWACRAAGSAAILVTCNRIEIYGLAEYADDALGHIAAFSRDFPDFSKYAYVKFGKAQVFRHMVRLACGLESQICGEAQILGQLCAWKASRALPDPLEALLDEAVSLAKNLRSASGLCADTGNIATLVLGEIAERMASRERYRIAVVGTGNIAELFARHRPPEAHLSFVAHKNYARARELAQISAGAALPLCGLTQVISESDVVIGATSSPHRILRREHFAGHAARGGKPLFIYDLATPRDADPAIGDIDGVRLYNLDTLSRVFDRHNEKLRPGVRSASVLVDDALDRRPGGILWQRSSG